ncbi:MAG: hypothetical protein AAGB93_25150, partial [Planctomycetota bacterium]
ERRASGPRAVLLLAALALSAAATACVSRRPTAAEPVRAEASSRFLAAWEASRRHGFAESADAQRAALVDADAALALDPGWAAPARFVDEWRHRRELTLPDRYAEHLEAAEAGQPSAAYLAGRLGGSGGADLLALSVRMDPSLGWGWHGVAWQSFLAGDPGAARRAGQRAIDLVRDPHELALFTWAQSRYLRAGEDALDAIALLRATLAREGPLALRPSERTYLEVELATIELRFEDEAARRRGVERGLDLIRRPDLSHAERAALATTLASTNGNLVARTEIAQRLLAAASDSGSDAERDAIRALVDRVLPTAGVAFVGSSSPIRLNGGAAVGTNELEVAFGTGDLDRIRAEVDAWQAALPRSLVGPGPSGTPVHRPLAALVSAVRGPGVDGEIAEALLGAGWFREALAFARAIRDRDPEISRETEARAVQGRATLDALLQLTRRIDAREAFARSWGESDEDADVRDAERVSSLRALGDEIVRTFGRSGFTVEEQDRASPTIEYGFIGAVLHPGTSFSAEDERLGRGEEGEPVPGIAALFRRMNRFALVGNGVGQGGPDATVLRVVGVEAREGAHLGRPFRGTVFWCQGADVPGRFGRLGAGISGAALHEGYYLDIAQIAAEQRTWVELAERFVDAPARAAALSAGRASHDRARRTEVAPALGAGDRMRLTVLETLAGIEEPGTGEVEPTFPIDHLTHVVATHEEGHLCDRAGWYPLSFSRVMSLLSFAGAHGFSGARIARALEERAQLVAIGACRDPRVPLVDLLDAAEDAGGGSVTPHGAAYRRLLARLVERLEREYLAGDWEGAGLDPDGRWIDQLHRLDPEALRGLAIREARARGLARD